MAARLALSRVDVTIDGETHKKVSVTVRNNVAVVRQNGRTLYEVADVVAVNQTARRLWSVQFKGGTVWSVSKPRCLPCGGG
jgi:hypothetical protein